MRSLRFALLLTFALGACRPKELPSEARIGVTAAHATLMIDSAVVELPDGDVDDAQTPVTRNESGRLLAYRTKSGSARVIYRIGTGLFVGPSVAVPVDYAAVPEPARAYAALWESAKTAPRRQLLAAEVEREKGAPALVDLLAASAPITGPGWDELRARVPASDALKKAFAPVFASSDPLAVARAARIVDLDAQKTLVATKAGELAKAWREPRAAAVLLRSVLARDAKAAGAIACDALKARPKASDEPDDALLAEAAYLTFATTDAECTDLAKLLEHGLETTDHPSFRCNADGPLGWRTASKQDEPLCTKAEVTPLVEAAAKRAPAEIFTAQEARAELFAYAALLGKGKLPPAFLAAHERRRYALVQPKTPSCEDLIAAKTPCACDEATVRQSAATNAAGHITIGVCEFDVDDATKKITNVLRFNP